MTNRSTLVTGVSDDTLTYRVDIRPAGHGLHNVEVVLGTQVVVAARSLPLDDATTVAVEVLQTLDMAALNGAAAVYRAALALRCAVPHPSSAFWSV